MKKISLALIILIIVGICIPSVSASEEHILTDSYLNSDSYTFQKIGDARMEYNPDTLSIRLLNVESFSTLKTLYVKTTAPISGGASTVNWTIWNTYDSIPHNVDFYDYLTNQYIGSGSLTYNVIYGEVGIPPQIQPTEIQFWFDIDDWNIGSLIGERRIKVVIPAESSLRNLKGWFIYAEVISSEKPVAFCIGDYNYNGLTIVNTAYDWTSYLSICDTSISINRLGNLSTLTVESASGNFTDTSANNIQFPALPPLTWNVTNGRGKIYTGSYGSASPGTANVVVYVKNSQTGALIANSHIVIDGLVNGTYYPVANRTEPSGIFSITLQPTGGGKPNPDGYRLIATADGYNNPMPEINFTVDDYKQSIYCLLDPIAGGPVNDNKTFIDFFVRDMSSNPISGATVKFGKYTLITNSAGYTVFEVDKNNNYSWTISKSGYGPLTGNAVIGDAPRHTINTVLAPIVTPTMTTPIPTSPSIGPTPTMTAPTGEHVSNWLEWFAAHFGMILGGGVEIGKIFMWLCFTVPVGVYVGKEAKAGAAGFMAGAGIVTLFFVLIGWVPIWLVVLLALIIGLLYAKVFNTPDNGGGR